MPLLLPKERGVRREANFSGQPTLTWGTAVTSDTVAHTLPTAYTELIAATTFDANWVNIWTHTNTASATDTDSLVTIYVGAGGAEQVLVSTLLAGWAAGLGALGVRRYGFPLRVPSGSRLSARHQSVRVSTNVTVMVELLGGNEDHWVGQRVECVGANTATSGGTFLTPGSTSEGTLTSIATNTYDWGFVLPMANGNTDTTMNSGLLTVDVGSGASTAIPGLEDFLTIASNSEISVNLSEGRYCHMPASTTLYLRAQHSGTPESCDWCIYGVA
jgi:hypothetical protein